MSDPIKEYENAIDALVTRIKNGHKHDAEKALDHAQAIVHLENAITVRSYREQQKQHHYGSTQHFNS